MINKIGDINFKEIKRISPGQFYSMKNCAYKSLLAEAFDKKPLLPLSASAYFGTVLHNMLELMVKGIVESEDDFNAEFEKQIKTLEDDLQNKGFGFFVPLKIKLKNFGLKKIQLKKHLRSKPEKPIISSDVRFDSEKWFESQDKLIGGKVDLIIENGNNIEIIDFKTGAIAQDCLDDEGAILSDVKNEYKEQLKLYAYLYFENTKKFPTSLSLVDLAKQKFSVEFSEEECKAIFDEAKNLLKTTNDCVNTKSFSAIPEEENCRYCLYRPACSFFQEKLETDFTYNDVAGKINDVRKFQNGNVSVFLQNGEQRLTIKNFSGEKFDALNNVKNKRISIYNLRKEAIDFVYAATSTTVIYEQDNTI
ncbi:PD-(D/E)XK nuclease family protein [Niabella drilacis]|uniref:PD-(D/E)XK nuclease superfamily protein n=1 Tax=Niabella drilacis (strain DSM 25811 / CCM 8410 / CCUG 62505 / LMG 26954 / E90) TaxID=1285928 RepID=A0A1G6JB95_NIADE|nr:PD-(D/E)XK nuclease family protein [Niabella drilacis]SDC16011.1 PD-(D/E)XK nuclease superfamily protein [Niabella drilacis]